MYRKVNDKIFGSETFAIQVLQNKLIVGSNCKCIIWQKILSNIGSPFKFLKFKF